MSTASVSPVATAPAKKLTALETIEQEIGTWFKQREQQIENIKALDGAIQGGQRLLSVLKAEAEKAEAEAKKLLEDAEAEAKKASTAVETAVEDVAKKL
jgi:predicted  nucleic acid-binding Zn-ribbon protein